MADMKKVYDNLIIINLYYIFVNYILSKSVQPFPYQPLNFIGDTVY